VPTSPTPVDDEAPLRAAGPGAGGAAVADAAARTGGPSAEDGEIGDRSLTAGEVACLGGVTAVASVGVWSLALAQLGRHEGWLALTLGVITTGVLSLVARAVGGRRRVRLDPVELALLAVVVAAGIYFFVPGFHYAWVDKDPGVYVAHGFAIAESGDAYIPDPLLERGIEPTMSTGGRFPGLWIEGDHPTSITVQFYHLFSSLLATADDVGGSRALFNLNPLLAVGSVCVLVVAVRRAAGTVAATVAGALMVTSMMQVWQAKYPSTEILAQLLLSGALLAAILALDRRWAGGSFLAGVLLGVGFLVRPDGFLYIAIAAAAVALVIALDAVDRRVWALAGGLAITLPYALYNAYDVRGTYSAANDVPGLLVLLGICGAVLLAGYGARLALAALSGRHPGTVLWRPAEAVERWWRPIGVAICVLTLLVLIVYYYREDLFGLGYRYYAINDRVDRTFDELNLHWFSWFFTMRGLAAMWLGICALVLQRWKAPLFLLVLPGSSLLFLYLWDPKVAMRMMWWVRRFVPAVVPAVIVLIALALAFALTRRSVLMKLAGAVLAISLVVEWAGMSLPLRDHDEMSGSWGIAAAIADTAGDEQGLFLFPPGRGLYTANRNAPGAVWFIFGQDAARIPADYDVSTVEEYQRAFPDRPVFLVTPGEELPADLPADRFTKASAVTGDLVIWEETREHRPDEQVVIPTGVTVWRYDGAVVAPSAA
jgi:4-amino-4-deoxy-L-arabinose transferase-like glycosyltransferase